MSKWAKPRQKDRFTATELTDVDPDNLNKDSDKFVRYVVFAAKLMLIHLNVVGFRLWFTIERNCSRVRDALRLLRTKRRTFGSESSLPVAL